MDLFEGTDQGASISLVLDIGQGTGLAAATGVRPFLPPLLAGALARGDHAIDFDGTSYAFLESTWFLALVLALAVVSYVAERSEANVTRYVFIVAAVLGALMFAGSLEAEGREGWWGLPIGLLVAALSRLALGGLFDRTRARLEEGTRALLPVLADFLSLVMAFASLLFGVLGFLVFLMLLPLLRAAGSGDDEKYAGLRVLK